jgi:DNA-binding transcriptional ArsR family regulator
MSGGRRRTIKEAQHVRIYHSVMVTPAWRRLSCYARAGYLELSMRYGGPGSNNGKIPYSVREMAENLNISVPTVRSHVFKELKEHGFIVETRRGRYGRKRSYASEWRLTEFKCDATEQAPTHAYRQWQGSAQPISTKDHVRRAQSMTRSAA